MRTWSGELRTHAQAKADGFSLLVKIDIYRRVVALTRGFEDLAERLMRVGTAAPLWTAAIPAAFLPLRVHGELWVPGRQSSDVLRALNSRDAALRFDVFDVDGIRSIDLQTAFCIRYGLSYLPWREACGDPSYDTFQLEKLYPWLKRLEGVVLRADGEAPLKWKRERTIDLIVTGNIPGKGKYAGTVGALVCATNDGVERCSVGGFTDVERAEMHSAHTLAGRICEVKYQNVGAKGRLRHPRFVRWRPEKRADECGAEQDADLLAR